ncbi:MAG: AAA family ATPase [Butyribacter sp.]|uniref:AAA family ATPase n=1 Tax=Butyribacter sp. TaxID=2822465 RepID=UPI00383F7464|nr:AAA family ATPase [Clostridium sp.]MCQ5165282.1 ATP-binding protein [Roseburia hominis]
MAKVVSIGNQSFESIREKDNFYVDKTLFIREWWDSDDAVTLITRPRRFGKTLNMNMLECFFSNKYKDRGDLFEGLEIWRDEKYRELQGTYPVIFLSFASIKQVRYDETVIKIKDELIRIYNEYDYIMKSGIYNANEKMQYQSVCVGMSDTVAQEALKNLSNYLSRYYGKKVIILLDEYDTPMQEAYVNGYWEELVGFTRSLFNSTFKTNPYLERAIMTGITRVSKESIFSDLNNLKVITVTSDEYSRCFGFTEDEVFAALEEQGLSSEKEKVKLWYDGFTFGESRDIYNPWSIINFLDEKKYKTYWADSSSNGLVNELIRTGSAEIKKTMETLMAGGIVEKNIDEQIVFEQLKTNKDAVWSLLLASGYLRVEAFRTEGRLNKKIYSLKLTNYEVEQMFGTMIERWFGGADVPYNEFISAMISGDLESMNEYMNRVTRGVISYFDTGKTPSDEEPERFYHGLVLGLMVDQVDNYILNSNRESGYGRYDIMLEPIDKTNEKYPGIVIEFKVINPRKENTLEETVASALEQIEEKNYDAELIKRGVKEENIHHYGFAFKGKEVLIDGR